jgi:glycosyltransferase involved in cell wall biosynthesis
VTDGAKLNSPKPARSLVVFFGTYDSSAHPRVQVLIDGFTAAGCEVIELNRSLDFDTASRVKTAQQPWRAPGLLWRIARAWWGLRRDAHSLADRLGGRTIDLVVVGYLGQFDVHLASRLFDAPVALDYMVGMGATTSDRGSRSSVSRALAWVDRRATAAADVVLVDTAAQAAVCPSPTAPVVVPVGAPDLWFHDTTGHVSDGLSVVFFGLYTPLQGAPYIGDAISELAGRDDIRFTMIGDGQDRGECERRAGSAARRVEWIDWLSRDDLAAEVARHDVCLGIFGTTPKARRVVPNKVYQGAAAGCAIVTSDTPPQRDVFRDAGVLCPAGDGNAIAGALLRLADDPEELTEKRRAARALAETFRPHEIVAPLIERMESAAP